MLRVKRGADTVSDYHLLIGKFKLRMKRYHQAKSQRAKYNTEHLSNPQVTNQFKYIISKKNAELQSGKMVGWTTDEEWEHLKAAWSSTCDEALGRRSPKHKE